MDANAKANNGRTLLISAAIGGNPELLKLLLKHGADVNATDQRGRSALWEAASSGPDVLRLLLESGGNVNARETSTQKTLREQDLKIIKPLLEKGAYTP